MSKNIDLDSNETVDIAFGGTNATAEGEALSNLYAPDDLGTVSTTLTMDVDANSAFLAKLPTTGTTTTISITNMPTVYSAWPVLHLITQATFDAPTWSGIDASGITLSTSTTHNIGFQPVKTSSAWKIVAKLMHSEADA